MKGTGSPPRVEVTAAEWPLGAPAREGRGRQVAPASPLSARLPSPSPAHTQRRASPGAA